MSGDQTKSAESGSGERQKEEVGIIQQIKERLKDLDIKFPTEIDPYIPKLIIGLVYMTAFLMSYQINFASGYFGSGLGIPSHNVGIFVSKLTSYRSFLMMFGFAFGYLINFICNLVSRGPGLDIARKAISLFFLYLLVSSRFFILFFSFLKSDLSYRLYLLLCIESIASGLFQMFLILLVPHYLFITFLSIHVLAFLFFIIQFVYDPFLSIKPLIMIKILFFMCLVVTIIAFGLWAFYLFYYHGKDPIFYKEELYKQNENMEKAISIYVKLLKLPKKVKPIFGELSAKFKEKDFLADITKELDESQSIISDILNLNNDFFTLLKDCKKSVNQHNKNLEKLYEEVNEDKSGSHVKNDKTKFTSQKSRYYANKFVKKVYELKQIFDESKKDNLLNLLEKLSELEKETTEVLKLFNNGVTKNSIVLTSEILNLQKKLSEIYDKSDNTPFNFDNLSSNTLNINDLSKEIDKIDNLLQEKIKSFSNSIDGYEQKISEIKTDIENITKFENEIIKILLDESDYRIFCYIMITVACFFRHFLYPSIIPHALLDESQSQIILLLGIIIELLFCFPVFILDDILNIFTLLIDKYFIYVWTLAGPPLIVLIFTFLAIHTKIRFFHLITESTGRVLVMSLFLISCCTLMESVSYACLSHYVFYQFGFSHTNLLFLLLHQLLELFCTYFFSKLSAGYNHARVRLGHCLPTYTTNYYMTSCEEFWCMIKWTLEYTFKDIFFFFKMNIRQYL